MKLAASVANRKAPVDRAVLGVTLANAGIDALSQGFFVGNTISQAGAGQDREFHLGHVEPTAMLRGVVEIQLSGDGTGLLWRKCFVERGSFVRAEIVHSDPDHVSVRVHFDDMLHGVGEIDHGSPLGDQHFTHPEPHNGR